MVTASNEELVMETALKHINEIHIKKPFKAKMKASIEPEQGLYGFVR